MSNSTNWASALQLALQAGWSDEDISERLHELVAVLDALAEVYTVETFDSYMNGYNSFLEGARPINVVVIGKYEEVLDALAQERAGAFA
jgi:hypothetical protein